jgi:hypothetical protein
MNEIVFQRIGKVVPGNQKPGPDSEDRIDGKPIVLWHGSTPAAVLYTRLRSHAIGLTGEQRIERFDEHPGEGWLGRKRGPFPLVFGSPWSIEGKLLDETHAFDTHRLVTADVNGDGVDELLLPRVNGAIGVYSVDRILSEHSALSAPKGMHYRVDRSHTAKLKSHDVVLFLLSLESNDKEADVDQRALAKTDECAILRADGRGISRVPLPNMGVPIERVHAIGALNRPGSTDIDEILLVFDTNESGGRTYLSRQRPDGSTIAPPKEVYVPLARSSLKFISLAETTQVFLADISGGHLYFIWPDKAANWIADIDLNPLASSPSRIQILQPIDPGTNPKMMVAVDNRRPDGEFDNEALYAVNSDGQCFRPDPAKDAWQPIGKREPFLRLTAPTPDHRFVGVGGQPGTDIVLTVFSREAKTKKLSDDEIMEAAERFLQPAFVAERRKYFMDFGVKKLNTVPNCAEKERVKRGVTEEITTVEQWKRLLPDSYQDVVRFKKDQLLVHLNGALQSGFAYAFEPQKYRNIDEYKTWLTGLKLGPETVFELVRRGQVAASSKAAGYLPNDIDGSFNGWPLGFRVGPAGTSIVLPLDPTPSFELERQRPVFFQVTFPWKTP